MVIAYTLPLVRLIWTLFLVVPRFLVFFMHIYLFLYILAYYHLCPFTFFLPHLFHFNPRVLFSLSRSGSFPFPLSLCKSCLTLTSSFVELLFDIVLTFVIYRSCLDTYLRSACWNPLFSISMWERCFTYLTLGYILFFTACKLRRNSILCCTHTTSSPMSSSFLSYSCLLSPLTLAILRPST
jgi:hypothetical protein